MAIKYRLIIGWLLLLAASLNCAATTLTITANFSPSLEHPENNTFTNTTPQSGYCSSWPAECAENKVFSIGLGLSASLSAQGFSPGASPRESMFFQMPGTWRNVTVVNAEGKSAIVQFRVSAFSSTYRTRGSWTVNDHRAAWAGSSFVWAPAPCIYSGVGRVSPTRYTFLWKWPVSNAACYKIAKKELTGEPYRIENTSVAYEIKTPEPLKMGSGEYVGSLRFTAGPGGDFDFGDSFTVSDSVVDIVFKLSVNHELKLTTNASDHQVTLQPCKPGSVCSVDEGKANWERWMVTRVAPSLTGKSSFNLSSSGAFTVHLDCAQQVGKECALKSDNSGQLVPVSIMLNLPENIVDNNTGASVFRRPLSIGKDVSQTVFATRTYGQDKKGSLEYLVRQRDVETMLQTRPDSYRGTVTIIFDPNIY
ncbi:hypothetical protein [Vagococcus sp. WN89Y]|uniref:hypothetical protein n=1 Tax=Vagococcus sp. WN89Y TaxID=3457258 RepID=UPI003FCED68E